MLFVRRGRVGEMNAIYSAIDRPASTVSTWPVM
jgi:hypothetical protein